MTSKTKLVFLLTVALAFAGTLTPVTASTRARAKLDGDLFSARSSGRAIVGFTHDVDASTIARLAKAGVTRAFVAKEIDAVAVVGTLAIYERLAGWSDVAYVSGDAPLRFLNGGAKKDTKVREVRAGAKPLKRSYDGTGVTVAVVDTGIDTTHPDLSGRVVKSLNFEPSWVFDMINDGVYSDRLSEATGSPVVTYGHGTHVAGTVGGTGQAGMDEDFSGVAPGASLASFKIADIWEGETCSVPCDLGWEINALVAYEYLIEHARDAVFPGGIRVATNSWSIDEVDSDVEPISMIVQAAYRHGIVSVFAASNSGPGPNTVSMGPNRLEEVITVGAVCKTNEYDASLSGSQCKAGEIAKFSSRGPQVDVVAPGVDIWSTMAPASDLGPVGILPPPGTDNPASMLNNSLYYTAISGTSMATPHVAGIVALMLQANPKLTPAQVETILIQTATDKGDRGFDTNYGFGLVNAHRAVAAALAAMSKKKSKR